MPTTRTRPPAAKRKRYMKMFFVRYWGQVEPFWGIQSGLYIVRAANREDCAQYILRWWATLKFEPTSDDMLDRVREKVAEAKTVKIHGMFSSEEMMDCEWCEAEI